MDGYVVAGYAITFGTLAVYSIRTVLRGRSLGKQLQRDKK